MRGQSPVGSHRASQLSNPSNSQSFSQPPPPLSLSNNGSQPVLSASCQQILQTGASLNSSADAISHKPRIESLMKLGKESEATWLQIGE